ncbi:MAG TPA: hypothetical protein DCP63_02555 [Bacteroidetes bacterium]|nr:hypothetical protein [Bacteroidota bacterium]
MPPTSTRRENPSSDILPLFEFSNVVNSSLDLKFILGTVLLTVMGKMLVSKGMVLLKRERGSFEIVNAKGLDPQLIGQPVSIDKPMRTITAVDRIAPDGREWVGFFKSHEQKLLIPIVTQRHVAGFLTLGGRFAGRAFSRTDKQLINSLVNLSGSAIEKALMIDRLKEANRNLDRKFQELNTLFDLSKEFNVVLDADKVIRLLTFSLLGQIGVNRYAICLNEHGSLKIVASRLDAPMGSLDVLRQICFLKTAELTEDLAKQKKFRQTAEELRKLRIEVVIPMQIQNQVKGAILLGERLRGGSYNAGDLEFLYSLANLAIISVENARLFHETLEKQRMEDELAIAREIQQGLLPRTLPQIHRFDIAASNIPSKQVGGDYYDVVTISPNEYVFVIGDVSGKGTGAALLMANVQASLRAFAPMGLSLSEATSRINNLTCANTGQGKFITFFWGSLNLETRSFRYVNAGHNPPFLLRADGGVERLEIGGIILGLMQTVSPYPEGAVTLESGDLIVMFTDGVSEAMNARNEDFTEERLEQLLKQIRTLPAKQIISKIQEALDVYTRGTPQSDDITMLVLRAL